jgi:hypothetical protein
MVIERTLAWFGRNRRLAKDFEASVAGAEALYHHRQHPPAFPPSRKSLILSASIFSQISG